MSCWPVLCISTNALAKTPTEEDRAQTSGLSLRIPSRAMLFFPHDEQVTNLLSASAILALHF
jgi:hypothetical protein